MSQPLPTHISHYEIRGVLGQGGMGTVYLALDPALRRQVALKVLRADTDDQRERFRREARIVARLQHPNIVAIYAVGEHDRQPFIAMEYIEGEPLSDGIRRRTPWSLHRKLQMAADLCGGLAFAHRAGVVHRDVKPSNLMVSNGSGTLRLLDFGIARGVDAAATMDLTMLGNIVGTLNYMSPEQITGQALDHRSDIFAVGLVLYELLAYRQAFPGDNLATLTYRIVHGSAEPLRELQPDLDPELCAVVERAMARLPDDRYPHLEAMRTDLVRVATRLSPEAAAQLTTQGADRDHARVESATHLVARPRSDGGGVRSSDPAFDRARARRRSHRRGPAAGGRAPLADGSGRPGSRPRRRHCRVAGRRPRRDNAVDAQLGRARRAPGGVLARDQRSRRGGARPDQHAGVPARGRPTHSGECPTGGRKANAVSQQYGEGSGARASTRLPGTAAG